MLGVPCDVVYPVIPQVLRRFNASFPRMRVHLVSSCTTRLRVMFARGECDLILTTEDSCDPGGETLVQLPLVWVGAPGGIVWKQRPLRLAFDYGCIFRSVAQAALDRAGIPWERAVESDSSRTIEASVSADLAVHAAIEGTFRHDLEPVPHGGELPDLCTTRINLYKSEHSPAKVAEDLADLIRQGFGTKSGPSAVTGLSDRTSGAETERKIFAVSI